MSKQEEIRAYVDDHKKHFDAYPVDIEVDGKVYSWEEYWEILHPEEVER